MCSALIHILYKKIVLLNSKVHCFCSNKDYYDKKKNNKEKNHHNFYREVTEDTS